MDGSRDPGRRGIVLVLVSGLLVLMLVIGTAMFHLARLSDSGSKATLAGARLAFAATSGTEYAAARLSRDPVPRISVSVESRGDDWTCRGVPADPTRNPSWSHGENWIDDGDGVSESGESQLPPQDLDRDGAFSAWSGRLRGGGSPLDIRFSLKVESPEGRIPVNAGCLQASDLYGGTVIAGVFTRESSNTLADHWDVDRDIPGSLGVWSLDGIEYHRGLALVLNNLGVVLKMRGDLSTRCEDVPAGTSADPDDWVRMSWLGFDLIRNRPVGGYKTEAEIRSALKALPYNPVTSNPPSSRDHTRGKHPPPLDCYYTDAEIDKILPFLDLGPYDAVSEAGRTRGYDAADSFPAYVPINLTCAPEEVLAALWFNFCAKVSEPAGANGNNLKVSPFPGEPQGGMGWDRSYGRTGGRKFKELLDVSDVPLYGKCASIVLFRDEAHALAARVIALRGAGPITWQGLHETLMTDAPTLFQRDFADLAGSPVAQRNWTQAKAALAYQAVALDPYPYSATVGSAVWAAGWPIPGQTQPRPVIGFSRISRIPQKPTFQEPTFVWKNPDGSADPSALVPYRYAGDPIKPQGGTVAPPVRFRILSRGTLRESRASASIQADLRVGERVELTSQEDFERFTEQKRRRDDSGITAVDDPAATIRRDFPRVASLPRWNRRDLTASPEDDYFGFSRTYGALALASRENGLGSADIYFPFTEDFDGIVNDAAPPAIGSEYWCLTSPAYAPGRFRYPASDCRDFIERKMEMITPWQVSGGGIKVVDCPGMDPDPNTQRVQSLSLEFWGTPGSVLRFELNGGSNNYFELMIERCMDPATSPIIYDGTIFRVLGNFEGVQVGGTGTTANWLVQDGADPSWNYHVVLTVEAVSQQQTDFKLHVDGTNINNVTGTQMIYSHVQTIAATRTQPPVITLARIDELRLYGQNPVLDPTQVTALYNNQTRFATDGTYTSPLYRGADPIRLLGAQWSGVLPRNGSSMTVSIQPCDAGGNAIGPARLLAPWGPCEPLGDLPAMDAFRYSVTFVPAASGKDTPVFESITFLVRRPGRTGWANWSWK